MARGMRGGMDPRMMKKLQKQMKSEDLNVTEVIFRTPGKDLVFKSPTVTAMNHMGQSTYLVLGDPVEMAPGAAGGGSAAGSVEGGATAPAVPAGPVIPAEDIKLVAERAGVSEADARAALIEADGDIAEAIISLM
jgi:nascent polypeptide-associated complex subunit alpha